MTGRLQRHRDNCWCGAELESSVHPLYGRCLDCGTLVLRRQFTSEEIQTQYSLTGYWYIQQTQQENHPDIEERSVGDFNDRIPIWYRTLTALHLSPKRLLEIGCAHGGFLHYCRERGTNEVVGVEVDKATCEFARKRFALEHVYSGLFPKVTLPYQTFDVVCGFDVLEHFPDPIEAVTAIRRLLAPDGTFFFQTPCYRGEDNRWVQFRPKEHLFLFDENNVRRLFDLCDLRIDRIERGCFPDDMFILGSAKTNVTRRRSSSQGPKVAGDFSHGKDLTAIQEGSRFETSLRNLIKTLRPKTIIETGTYLGQGTTRIIASSLKECGLAETVFSSIECNPEHHRQAASNLQQSGLLSFVRLRQGLSVPRELLPTPEMIRKTTIEDADEHVFVDHQEDQRVELYLRETDFPNTAEDLLGACLAECGHQPDLVVLDSGGHMGNVEFNYIINQIKHPCHIALDDVRHIKHARSLEQIRSDARFKIVCESDEKFGFCIAEFAPAAQRCWCGGALEPSVHELYGRCVQCGTLALVERPVASQLEQFYTFDHYWHEHQTEDLKCPAIEQRAEDDLKDRIPVWHDLLKRLKPDTASLLEIGCAHGGFLHYCHERGIKTVVGAEVDERTCEFARKRFDLPHVYSGLFPKVRLPFDRFDAITGFDVLEHLIDPVAALKEVARLLDNDGVFLFQLPCYRGEGADWRMFCPINHVYLYNEQNLKKLFFQAGLEVDQILPGHFPEDAFVTGRKRRAVQSILWVRTDSIGDAVLASSMLQPVRAKYPEARLSVLCQQHVAELYETCPHVDAIVCFDKQKLTEDPTYRDSIVADIRSVEPDLILNSIYSREGSIEHLLQQLPDIAAIGMAGDLANLHADERPGADEFYSQLIQSLRKDNDLELNRHQDFLTALGIEAKELKPMLWVSPEDEAAADAVFKQHKLDPSRTIALFPGAQHEIRVYPRYAEALRGFRDYQFLLLGNEKDVALCEEIAAQLPGDPVMLAGQTTLRQLAALIARCRLYVGADTSAGHMACAAGVPNVVVVGGGGFVRFFPYSPLTSAVTLPLECTACGWQCSYSRPHCLKDIPAALLTKAVDQTLARRAAKPRVFVPSHSIMPSDDSAPRWGQLERAIAPDAVEIITVALPQTTTVMTASHSAPVPQAKPSHNGNGTHSFASPHNRNGRPTNTQHPQPSVQEVVRLNPALHCDENGNPVYYGISPGISDFIARYVAPGSRTIETGVGLSTLCFLARDAYHTAIAPNAPILSRLKNFCEQHGMLFERLTYYPELSQDVLPKINGQFDCALIDGGHGFPLPFLDFYYLQRRLKVGGFLIIDDIEIWTGETLAKFLSCERAWKPMFQDAHRAIAFRKVAETPEAQWEWDHQEFVVKNSYHPFHLDSVISRPKLAEPKAYGHSGNGTGSQQSLEKLKKAEAMGIPVAALNFLDIANAHFARGDLQSARNALNWAREMAPKHAPIAAALGSIEFQLGDFEEARRQFERAIKLDPRNPLLHTQLAATCVKLDDVNKVKTALRQALSLDAQCTEALTMLADHELQSGRHAAAAGLYEQLLALKPDDTNCLLAIGKCHYKLGDLLAATQAYEKVIAIDPDNDIAAEALQILSGRSGNRAKTSSLPSIQQNNPRLAHPDRNGNTHSRNAKCETAPAPSNGNCSKGQASATEPLVASETLTPAALTERINAAVAKADFETAQRWLVQQLALESDHWFSTLKPPLYRNTNTGRFVHQLMFTEAGKLLRTALPQLNPHCDYFPGTIVVLANGDVTTCCIDPHGKNRMASILSKPLKQIWDEDVKRILETDSLYSLPACHNCIGQCGVDSGNPFPSILSHPESLAKWRQLANPQNIKLQIEPYNGCNYACDGCATLAHKDVVMTDLDALYRGIESMLPRLGSMSIGNFGEPLLNPNVPDFIARCHAVAPNCFYEILTNGSAITEKMARRLVEAGTSTLVVGIHGAPGTEGMLRYSRKAANYDKVMNNLRNLIRIRNEMGKKKPTVALRVILFNWNDSEELMDWMRRDAKELGCVPTAGATHEVDSYHWLLDAAGGPRASKRFVHGSAALQYLIKRREFPSWIAKSESLAEIQKA